MGKNAEFLKEKKRRKKQLSVRKIQNVNKENMKQFSY